MDSIVTDQYFPGVMCPSFTSGFYLFFSFKIQTLLSDCAFYILHTIVNVSSMLVDVCMIIIDALIVKADTMSNFESVVFKVSYVVFNSLRIFLDISNVA